MIINDLMNKNEFPVGRIYVVMTLTFKYGFFTHCKFQLTFYFQEIDQEYAAQNI